MCNVAVRSFNKMLNQVGTSGEQQHNIMKYVAIIGSFKAQYSASQIIGFGLPKKTAHHKEKWKDVQSAFSERINTGLITNLKHIDPQAFLSDCKAIFKRRIQNALKTTEALKVNGTLVVEFQIIKASTAI